VEGGFIRGLGDLEGRFGAEAPPTKKNDFVVGAASAATLASSKMGGSGLGEAASSVALGILKAGSGLKPLLQKDRCRFGRSGFSRDLCVIEGGRFGIVWGAAFIRGLRDLEGRKFGAEAPSARRLGPWIDGFFPKRGRIDAV
jgi:hypothetical protein